ncbi:Low-density lipoprotein (LDL) receptor class A repeat [Trinorchestia longiramus]|nr:Low-density lipoprotein (LDL) receptor class A repeat [Trinorchestia longiramus]
MNDGHLSARGGWTSLCTWRMVISLDVKDKEGAAQREAVTYILQVGIESCARVVAFIIGLMYALEDIQPEHSSPTKPVSKKVVDTLMYSWSCVVVRALPRGEGSNGTTGLFAYELAKIVYHSDLGEKKVQPFLSLLFSWCFLAKTWYVGQSFAATQTFVENPVDVADECLKYGTCDQVCVNTKSAFECFCVWGYVRNRTAEKCEASTSTDPMKLFFNVGNNIYRMQDKDESLVVVVAENTSVAGLDFLFSEDKLLWADSDRKKIFSRSLSNIDTNDSLLLSLPSFSHVTAMAVDWVNWKLFVADDVGQKVDVFDWNSFQRTILLWQKIKNPIDLALDPKIRFMFLAANNTIIRADLDGRNLMTLGGTSNPFPPISGIAVDRILRRVFWCSSRDNVIETASYDGSGRVIVVKGSKSQLSPKALAMFERQIYWTEASGVDPLHAVRSSDKFSNMEQVYGGSTPKLTDKIRQYINFSAHIIAVHELIQTEAANRCRPNNGDCDHMCLLSRLKAGYRCLCDVGYALADDGKTCTRIEEFLLYSLRRKIIGRVLDPHLVNTTINENPLNSVALPDMDIKNPVSPSDMNPEALQDMYPMNPVALPDMDVIGVDFDAHNDVIYFADLRTSEIYRTDRFGKYDEKVISAPGRAESKIEALALDWVAKNLYVVDAGVQSIWVTRASSGQDHLTLFRNLSKPRGIALHPNKGLLFFSEWGQTPNINLAHLDGSNVTPLPGLVVKWPNGLAIDLDRDLLYWCDAVLDWIQYANLDGSGVRTIPGLTLQHPFSLAILDDWLYVSEWQPPVILRMNKEKGDSKAPLDNWSERPFTVKAYSRRNQPLDPSNPCTEGHHNCEKFCFTVPIGAAGQVSAQCGCPEGQKLLMDGRSCAIEVSEAPTKLDSCSASSFECRDSTCIPEIFVCDGEPDCPGAEDERQDCEKTTCLSIEFTCSEGLCIPIAWVCDGEADCVNGEDEADNICPSTGTIRTCSATEFSCGSGSCIPQQWVCDKDDDCRDGSDEEQNCTRRTCAENEFACDDGNCIPQRWVCDSVKDCSGGTDEEQNCTKATCAASEYTCGDGSCIPNEWQCDREEDCFDGSDEGAKCARTPCPDGAEKCGARSSKDTCGNGKFTCENGNCIHRSYRCDQKDDCGDNSDEGPACQQIICNDSFFQCPVSMACIPQSWICDGWQDCIEGDDERACPLLACGPSEFRCTNHELCLPETARCDGIPNCIDLSDELSCSKQFVLD